MLFLFLFNIVNFDHFQILRAIGKGSFGKVCIVEKKDKPGQLYAMKYVHKIECTERGSLRNILREVNILSKLEHPFLANLWFSFQDEEDLFMICDLLLGGDLRYHIQHNVNFTEESVGLFIAEISLALDYLKNNNIIHRDIKPDNILLDENGHAHVTDFNVATVLENGQLATAMSGTRPYIAPEIYQCAETSNLNYKNKKTGYSYEVDWWSLGVLAWETLCSNRPYNLHSGTSYSDAIKILQNYKPIPCPEWSKPMIKLLKSLLQYDQNKRLTNINELQNMELMKNINFDQILNKNINAKFIPSKNHLNCDPTFELEEMIIETRPLHKKKKRLAKQRSLKSQDISDDSNYSNCSNYPIGLDLIPEYPIYNREREMENKLRELKEKQWEEELKISMAQAEAKLGFVFNLYNYLIN